MSKHPPKNHSKLRKLTKSNRFIPALVICIIFAGLGIYFLTLSHAASPYVSSEAESGTLASPATSVTDSNASGGKAVQFGTPSTSSNSCTNPTYTIPLDPNNAQSGQSIGNFYVTNDTWNASGYKVAQTIYICNYNNWYATATADNSSDDGAVKTYPNVHEDFNSSPLISSFKTISSSFAETAPHVGIYEYAYDMWLNGVAANTSTEVMIWNDNFNQTPGGSKQGTFTDGGQTYTVYSSGTKCASGCYIAFVDNTNVTSGTVNILDFYNWIINTKGWLPTSATLGQIDYGVEVVSTNGSPANFQVNNFSLTTN